MSGHYEVVFSLFLRDDLPAEVLAELSWHLGLSNERPGARFVDDDEPQLRPDVTSYLPGGETAALVRQYRYSKSGVEHHAWGLYARLSWLDDRWAEVWWQLAQLLARWADHDGYAGFYREEHDDHPTVLLVRNGEVQIVDPGAPPG